MSRLDEIRVAVERDKGNLEDAYADRAWLLGELNKAHAGGMAACCQTYDSCTVACAPRADFWRRDSMNAHRSANRLGDERDDTRRALEAQTVYAVLSSEAQETLADALTALLDHYTQLVNSGDAGNWDPEEEPVVIGARDALAVSAAALAQAPEGAKNHEELPTTRKEGERAEASSARSDASRGAAEVPGTNSTVPGGSHAKLWLWRNGPHEYWAFDNPFPTYDGGDPQTLGEPCGYALVKPSVNGRPEVSDEDVMRGVERAASGGGLAADAARYRYLRDRCSVLVTTHFWGNGCRFRTSDELDAEIDKRVASGVLSAANTNQGG